MKRPGLVLIAFLLVLSPRLSAQTQAGPNYVVTTLTDRNNTTAKVDDCSLREAIRAATVKNVPAVITFKEGLRGTLSLNATFGQLNLTTPVRILGLGARVLTISAGASQRVFRTSGGPHLISGMTLQGGRISISSVGEGGGGGVWNSGTLTIEECTLSGNQTTSTSGFTAKGGGIHTTGTLSLIRSTLTGNSATGGSSSVTAGSDGYGGAVFNEGSFSALQCTFQGNTGVGGDGADRKGFACGAIYNNGNMTLEACTVSGNTGTGGARFAKPSPAIGGIFNQGTCNVTSSIIAGNTATGFAANRDVRGSFGSGGFNFIGATTGFPDEYPATGFNKSTDQIGSDTSPKDPKLGSLQDNGGAVNTMLPQTGSPLIDKGKGLSEILDQRGAIRLIDNAAITNAAGGDGTDIGAVESGAPVPTTIVFFGTSAGVTLKGDPGATYQFQYSDNLLPPWTNISGQLKVAAGSGQMFFVDPGPLPSRRFYRAVKTVP